MIYFIDTVYIQLYSRIAEDLEMYLPNMESLILTNNAIQDLVSTKFKCIIY